MGIKITDCTIRDGGYLLNKNSDPSFVKGILQGLVDAGIDFIETGFLQTNSNGETLVFSNSQGPKKFFPDNKKSSEFLGFCDNSRYSPELLDEFNGTSFRWLRISFAKHELDSALDFCKKTIEKGYRVQFNPMDTISYSDEEILDLIRKVNTVKPDSLSIVDTFGAMYIKDVIHFFQLFDSSLDKDISIGLHSHDNLGLSCALAETMCELAERTERDIIIDGSLFGMGRGAGNAKTELLADYLNKYHSKNYDISVLLKTVDKFIKPLLTTTHWGYDLPMFVCGTAHSHVDNVYHLSEKYNCTINDIFNIINQMPLNLRTRYGKDYSKNDFSHLDEIYNEYMKREK